MPAPSNRRTPLQEALAERVKARRDELDLSQDAFAHGRGIDRTYLAALESGRRNPTLRTLARLAKALDVDLGDLLQGLQDIEPD